MSKQVNNMNNTSNNRILLQYGFTRSTQKQFIKSSNKYYLPDDVWISIKELAGIYNVKVNWNCSNEIYYDSVVESMQIFTKLHTRGFMYLVSNKYKGEFTKNYQGKEFHVLFWKKFKESKRDKKQLLQEISCLINNKI